MTPQGPLQLPASGQPPKQAILLLHGLGANGQDLISLAEMLAPILPDALFYAPDAPFPCDMAPQGYQWFSLQNLEPATLHEGAEAAAPAVLEALDYLQEQHHVPLSHIALFGFSQGTMMSLHVALRHLSSPCAGVLGYSGALLAHAPLPTLDNAPPICLIHGEEDPVVPFAAMEQARATLQATGINASTHAIPHLGHGIDPRGIDIGTRFLRDILES